MSEERKTPRALLLFFALAFLFETWIWDNMVAALHWVAARIPWSQFKAAAVGRINRLPAFVAVLLFGVPLFVAEFGAFISVVLVALGHFMIGAAMYVTVKIVGVGLLAVIFDLTREKLLTLPWFVVLYRKFNDLHEFAARLVAPYRAMAAGYVKAMRERAQQLWSRFWMGARAAP